MSVISVGRMRAVYEQAVKRFYPDYMGLVFEKMCQEYLLRYAKDLPILLSNVGQWWGTDSKTRREVQIDIVGAPVDGNEYLIGSCKYRNEKIGTATQICSSISPERNLPLLYFFQRGLYAGTVGGRNAGRGYIADT